MASGNNANKKDPHKKPGRKRASRKVVALAAVFMSAAALSGCADTQIRGDMSYTDFIEDARAGKINRITVDGQMITINSSNLLLEEPAPSTEKKKAPTVIAPDNENIREALEGTGVEINVVKSQPSFFSTMLMTMLPMILFIGFFVWLMRRQSGVGNEINKSNAKMLEEIKDKVTFDDVAGIEEAKEDMKEVVTFLKDGKKYHRLGGKMPKGVLLVGPPGTGKTLAARAVAGEAGVPFFQTSGSKFVELFVGRGAARVRSLFAEAKKHAPCIIFIDEIDAVGKSRDSHGFAGNDEREQTLNELLVQMDGFEGNEGVVIMAATNRPEILDAALTRPGRFDRQIVIGLPDLDAREKILKVHAKNKPLDNDVDLRVVARGTPGFSGADLANLVNEAALLATRRDHEKIRIRDFEDAKDKILMGDERRTLAMTETEKKLTAYHEGGHALVAHVLRDKGADPIHKATIIPRGRALGMVMQLPEGDRVSMSRQQLKARLAVAAAGRQAEIKIFGYDHVTTGASSDIQMMTQIARRMVTEWGLSDDDALGMLGYGGAGQENYLGQTMQGGSHAMADETVKKVDAAVRKIVDEAVATAARILDENEKEFHALAKALLDHETLTGDEIRDVIQGKEVNPRKPNAAAPVTLPPAAQAPQGPQGKGPQTPPPAPAP